MFWSIFLLLMIIPSRQEKISSDIGIFYLMQIRIIFRGLPHLNKCQMLSTRLNNLTTRYVPDAWILIKAETNLTKHRNSVLITFLFYKLYVLQTLKWLNVYPQVIMPIYFPTMYDKILKSFFVIQWISSDLFKTIIVFMISMHFSWQIWLCYEVRLVFVIFKEIQVLSV